jgi:hypothetical protein
VFDSRWDHIVFGFVRGYRFVSFQTQISGHSDRHYAILTSQHGWPDMRFVSKPEHANGYGFRPLQHAQNWHSSWRVSQPSESLLRHIKNSTDFTQHGDLQVTGRDEE